MSRRGRLLVWLTIAVLPMPLSAQTDTRDPFAFYGGAVTLTPLERATLDGGSPVVRLLPRGDREMAVFAAVPVDVDGDRLVGWIRDIEDLKKSDQVQAIGRFSNPPRLEDLSDLSLDWDDLDAIRSCRPGSCGVKLSEEDMAVLKQAATEAGLDWRRAVQDAYRRTVFARVEEYLRSGYRGMPTYVDQRAPVSVGDEFGALLDQSVFLSERLPELAAHLRQYPDAGHDAAESFLYWSKETLGGKPMVIVTHSFVSRHDGVELPEALVVSRHVYANHYVTGSLAVTALTGRREGAPGYLTYLNRSRIDVLGGIFGRVTRLFIERRLRAEAAEVVDGLRRRLEQIPPES